MCLPAEGQQEGSEASLGVLLITEVLPFLQYQPSDQHVRNLFMQAPEMHI